MEIPLIGRGASRGRALAAAAFLALIALPSASEPSPIYRSAARVDWERRIISVDITLDLAAAGLRLPAGRLEAEKMVDRDLASLSKDAIFALTVDSHRDVERTIEDGTIDVNALLALPREAKRMSAAFSKDMKSFVAKYELPLAAIASLYIDGASAPARHEAPLEWRASRPYTGIVVYAKGELPVRGEVALGVAEPCLFPRIYDDTMRLLIGAGFVEEAVMREEGPVGYATSLSLEAAERVGADPLRVMALALFGDDRSDIVVSREDALRILNLGENRELLAKGRVLVIVDDIERELD